jgi:flagellar basal-body rod modification protein FlgD
MSFTSPTTTATTAAAATAATAPVTKPKSQSMNENQFLQLMMAELKNQNPMDPSSSDPTKFMSQLAQFTALEQETNTAQSTSQIAASQSTNSAVALIGHTVSYTDPNTGASGSGLVQSVQITSSGATLTIGGNAGIAPSSVTEVS